MKTPLLAVCFGLTSLLGGCAAQLPEQSPLARSAGATSTVAEPFHSLVLDEHRAGRFDGIALVSRDRDVLLESAVGLADRRFGVPHNVEEKMPVASVTKQFVAVCIMRQVQAGRVALDEPISTYLPGIERPWAKRVTVRQLLTHRSGLPQPDAVVANFYVLADLAPDAVSLAKLVSAVDLVAEPGTAFSYNNTDYILLSALLELVLAKPLGAVLAQEIFVPANMGSSGLVTGREIIAGLASSYEVDSAPSASAKVAAHEELANYSGAGAAYSTARDLRSFDLALMNDLLLRPEMSRMMLESSPETGYGAMGCWVYTLPIGSEKALRVVERHGSIGGYNVVNLFVPSMRISVILLCNVSSFAEPQTWMRQGLAFRLLEAAVNQKVTSARAQ